MSRLAKCPDASVTMLTSRGMVFDLASHLVALSLIVALKAPCPTTLIRNGVVIPPWSPGMIQYPDEAGPALDGRRLANP